MAAIPEYIEIASPTELFRVIFEIKSWMDKGLLEIVEKNCELDQIKPGKPWPSDVIRFEFKHLKNEARYELVCETYHGSGGCFALLD